MRRILTEDFIRALLQWRQAEGLTYDDIGQIAGLNRSAVCQWFSGKSKSMYATTYAKLYPHISKYLPADFPPPLESNTNNGGAMVINNGGTNYGNAISHYTLSVVLRKITDSPNLTAEEKIKFIKVLQE